MIQKAYARIQGVVQGIGFRPFVARLAKEHGIAGFVKNESGHVLIEAAGEEGSLLQFLEEIQSRRPAGSHIARFEKRMAPLAQGEASPSGFAILKSGEGGGEGLVMPSPDIALCEDCLRELFTPGDPRYRNPFISCTNCGPRFSILRRIPYDRAHTAMDIFPMCPLCQRQYTDPEDRRFHAQTVCCNDCGPKLFYEGRREAGEGEGALQFAVAALKRKEIIAIKGIGGYHFTCDPFDEDSITRLRALKGREHKPFAVMFENLKELSEYCEITSEEEELLKSPARPIVLLMRKRSSDLAPGVCAASPYLGAFLPYTPLQHLILRETGPLVMTSANYTSLPIMKDDGPMLAFFKEHQELGGVLYHDRAILRRLDDSVAAVVAGEAQLIRRARGYVPFPFSGFGEDMPDMIALGPQEKNTVCVHTAGYIYPSTETGDLDSMEAVDFFRETAIDMQRTLKVAPKLVACDLHPGYESTKYAQELGLPVLQVQHHFAHTASVMAEHGLTSRLIGVAFDGTGYGEDGTVWGGEFLIASPEGFTRAGHLKAVKLLGSDESVRQGFKSAACMRYDAGIFPSAPPGSREALLQAAWKNNVNTIRSSSMGRLFDAASSILGVCHESHYGGQCAIELENAAARCLAQGGEGAGPFSYDITEEDGQFIADMAPCIRELYQRREAGEDPGMLALRFHRTVIGMTVDMCMRLGEKYGLREIALSGGTFLNRILVTELLPLLQKAGFTVYRNRQLPPGDGCVSLGQAYHALHRMGKKEA